MLSQKKTWHETLWRTKTSQISNILLMNGHVSAPPSDLQQENQANTEYLLQLCAQDSTLWMYGRTSTIIITTTTITTLIISLRNFCKSTVLTLHCAAKWTPSSQQPGLQRSWPGLVCWLCTADRESGPWLTVHDKKNNNNNNIASKQLAI